MGEPLKDKDCTIDTPVTLGKQDDPIYGKGIRIRPRVDGRKDTKHWLTAWQKRSGAHRRMKSAPTLMTSTSVACTNRCMMVCPVK